MYPCPGYPERTWESHLAEAAQHLQRPGTHFLNGCLLLPVPPGDMQITAPSPGCRLTGAVSASLHPKDSEASGRGEQPGTREPGLVPGGNRGHCEDVGGFEIHHFVYCLTSDSPAEGGTRL